MNSLTFDEVSGTNRRRCDRWHGGFPQDGLWSGADWSNAMQGEAGEVGNVVKKLRRLETGLWGNKEADAEKDTLLENLAHEMADTYLYLDLLATYYGVDLPAAIIDKFNIVSERAGFPERL